jgi:uncharacterized protein YhbP (UPF0306 family)
MSAASRDDIISILEAGQDLTLATLREDGWPQATTVSYASDGLDIYFGCGAGSQKARNLARDSRVSLTVNLPYEHWDQIRGLSLAGRAVRLQSPEDLNRSATLFLSKFAPEIGKYVAGGEEMALFRIKPEVVTLLDYSRGFGHTDLIQGDDLRQPTPLGAH